MNIEKEEFLVNEPKTFAESLPYVRIIEELEEVLLKKLETAKNQLLNFYAVGLFEWNKDLSSINHISFEYVKFRLALFTFYYLKSLLKVVDRVDFKTDFILKIKERLKDKTLNNLIIKHIEKHFTYGFLNVLDSELVKMNFEHFINTLEPNEEN